jgi:Pectate lyase superfamily protein
MERQLFPNGRAHVRKPRIGGLKICSRTRFPLPATRSAVQESNRFDRHEFSFRRCRLAREEFLQRRLLTVGLFAGLGIGRQKAAMAGTVNRSLNMTSFIVLNSIKELLSFEIADIAPPPVVIVMGYFEPVDDGGGIFHWSAGATLEDNSGTCFKSQKSAKGRWLRVSMGGDQTVKHFGARGDGKTDDTAAIQAALDSLQTSDDTLTGGVIRVPAGRYNVSSPLRISAVNKAGLPSATLQGEGMHNTVIAASSDFKGEALLCLDLASYCKIEDLHLFGRNDIDAGLKDVNGGSHLTLRRVFAQKFRNGFLMKDSFMTLVEGCRAKFCFTGFRFAGFHTSLFVTNCYALDNYGPGFHFSQVVYSNIMSCGSDNNKVGYRIDNSNSVIISGCGAEQCELSAFEITGTEKKERSALIKSTNVRLISCFATDCNKRISDNGSAIHVESDNEDANVFVESFQEHSSASLYSVTTAGKAVVHTSADQGSVFKKKIAFAKQQKAAQNLLIRRVEVDGTQVMLATIHYPDEGSLAGGMLFVEGVPDRKGDAVIIVYALAAHASEGTLVELSRSGRASASGARSFSCQLKTDNGQPSIIVTPGSKLKGGMQFTVRASGNFLLM